MINVNESFVSIAIFSLCGLCLAFILCIIPFIIGRCRPYKTKNLPYECGIAPLGDTHQKFDIKFYIVAMLFIIFDIEIVLLVPFAMHFKSIGVTALIGGSVLLFVLVAGFIYEWKIGALEQ